MSVLSRLWNYLTKPLETPPGEEWCDDQILRDIAQRYREDRIRWVFASDLTELYDALDQSGIDYKIMIRAGQAAALQKALDRKPPLSADHMATTLGTAIGPSLVDGFALHFGKDRVDTAYCYNIVDSWFDFTIPSHFKTRNVRHYCGLDKPPTFIEDIKDAIEQRTYESRIVFQPPY